jgi:hypothetical protein
MKLRMFVALLREWYALDDVRRSILGTAQSAVAGGFLDRGKSLHVANFQRPGQPVIGPTAGIILSRSTRSSEESRSAIAPRVRFPEAHCVSRQQRARR